jgi:hypothetical protein
MRQLPRTRITITLAAAVALMLAMTASMLTMSASVHAASSIRVTQSTEGETNSLKVTQSNEDGLVVKCEGDLNCKIIGDDDAVVATSEDNNTNSNTVITTTSNLNQSNPIQSSSDFDTIDEHEDLGAMIEGMVNRLFDEISGKLANLAISI